MNCTTAVLVQKINELDRDNTRGGSERSTTYPILSDENACIWNWHNQPWNPFPQTVLAGKKTD